MPFVLRARFGVMFVSVLLLSAACKPGTGFINFKGAAFTRDESIEITAPKQNQVVRLPLTVSWDVKRPLPAGTRFLVLFDRNPMRPFSSLARWVRGQDPVCKRSPGCPDGAYLKLHGLYVVAGNTLLLGSLPSNVVTGTHAGTKDLHTLSIVLLDAAGNRMGEQYWSVDFSVSRT